MSNSTGMVILALIALAAGGFKLLRGDFNSMAGGNPVAAFIQSFDNSPQARLEASHQEYRLAEMELQAFQRLQAQLAPGGTIQVQGCNGAYQTVPVTSCKMNGKTMQQVRNDYLQARNEYQQLKRQLLAQQDTPVK
jgi:hypothetical protein